MYSFITRIRMNKWKKNLSVFLITILIIGGVMTDAFMHPAYATSGKWKKLDASVETIAPTSIKVSWKAHKNVAKWKVQIGKLEHPKTDNIQINGNFQTVANLKQGSTCYTIKKLNKDNYYYFRILGYTKNKGKLVLAYKTDEQQMLGRTGIRCPYFLFDEYYDYHFSPTEIGLPIAFSDYGLKPDDYQIYRKNCDVSGSEYDKIATIPAEKYYYIDKSVLAGKTYLYKVRAYKRINGKIVYSTWSSAERLTAINQYGTFSLKKISTSEDDKALIIKLTSDRKYNADLCFLHNSSYNFSLKNNSSSDDIPLQLDSYSQDGVLWEEVNAAKTDVTLTAAQSIYLKLKVTSDTKGYVSDGSGLYINMIYNKRNCFLNILFDGSGMTEINL